jgi:PAS domain S-box-containing protein
MGKRLAILPVPAFILAIGLAAALDVRGIYEPFWLLPTVNMVFLFIPGCIIAYVSVQGYLKSGSLPLLLFGSAAMVYGTGSGVGGWMIGILGAVDAAIVLHNTVSAIGGILNVWSGLLATRVSVASSGTSRRTTVYLLYVGLGGVVAGLSIASLRGLTPAFVLPDGGFSPIRNVTLAIAVAGFVVSALLFWKQYNERRSDFFFWGAVALAMLSVGLSGLILQRGVGTLVGWCSRSAQYIGSAYFLIAVVRAWRAAQRTNVPVALAVANLFREAEANLRVLIETATDAIVAFDESGRVLLWSGAAEQLLSYPKEEVLGHGLGGLLGCEAAVERWTAQQGLPGSTDGIVRLDQNLQADVRRRDGTTFTAELSASARIGKAMWVGIVILRDVTERKRTMDRLARVNRDLRTISLCNQILVRETSEEVLLREVCRIIVEVGGHRAAWIGFAAEGTNRSLQPAAVVGCDPERVDRHVADLADPAWERCPIVMAIRTGSVQVVPDIPGGPPRCPWHDEAVRLGFRASIALPLTQDERPFGALTIYSAHRDAFDAEDVKLLSELADDLAYGIRAIRTRLAHERAMVEIESLARFPRENPNPILRFAKNGKVLYANAPSAPLLRLWETDVGGRMPDEWKERIQQVLETRGQERLDVACGDQFFSVLLTAIRDGGYVNLYGRDITDRKQAEMALLESRNALQAMVETSPLAIVVTNREGLVTIWNAAAERIFGWSAQEALGCPNPIFPSDKVEELNEVRAAILQGKTFVEYEMPPRRKDGTRVTVSFSATALRGADGVVMGILAMIADITDRKRLEADRLRLEAQLRQQQKLEAIGTLASGVAHEINNPLTGILNYAQLIADTAAPDNPAAGHAREIIAETERVATIVRNLLQFARQERQTHSPARLQDIVEQTLSLLRAVFRRDQITLTVDVPADLPVLKCRSQQLQQVLMNLLTNARDALNEKYPGYHVDKMIQVSVRRFEQDGRSWLRVTVADQGPGIPPEIQARIFDPFFTTKPRDKGTGLGLSISHGIVQDHHGRLRFETVLGTGTQFHLDLPVDNGWRMEGE